MPQTSTARLLALCAVAALASGCVALPEDGYYDAPVAPAYGGAVYGTGVYSTYPVYPAPPLYPASPAYRPYPVYPAYPAAVPLYYPHRDADWRRASERERHEWRERDARERAQQQRREQQERAMRQQQGRERDPAWRQQREQQYQQRDPQHQRGQQPLPEHREQGQSWLQQRQQQQQQQQQRPPPGSERPARELQVQPPRGPRDEGERVGIPRWRSRGEVEHTQGR